MKKIMFTDDLTKAVLEGRKTMTRRILSVQAHESETQKAQLVTEIAYNAPTRLHWNLCRTEQDFITKEFFVVVDEDETRFSPPFEANTIVALAQRYSDIVVQDPGLEDVLIKRLHLEDAPGWSNKMYVASELMPHQIRVNSWRVERLQDITEEDCLREGIYEVPFCAWGWEDNGANFETPREAFAALINLISGKGTWERNPWVWVFDFNLVR